MNSVATVSMSDPATIALCIVAVVVIGMSKGGFVGLGALATPIAAMVLPPAVAAGLLLPILIAQDAMSVWYFRQEWDRWIIAWMLPGAVVGIAAGYLFATAIDEAALILALGLITIGFAAHRLWTERGKKIVAASDSPGWVGLIFGSATGFTSQISHAGAPAFQIWVAPRKLPHRVYIGTNAILFAAINWIKVPAYVMLGSLNNQTLRMAAMLLPAAIVATWLSIKFIDRLATHRFYTIAYWLMLLLGVKLVADGLTH